MSSTRPFCFVCGKIKSVGVFQLIEGCIVPGTFKPIKDILKYFEKVINQRLDLTPTSAACRDCLEYLFNYDRLVRNLSQVQRQIANSLLSCRKKKPFALAAKKDVVTKAKDVKSRLAAEEKPPKPEPPEDQYSSAFGEDQQQQDDYAFSDLNSEDSTESSEEEANLDIPCHICGELFSNQDCLEKHIKSDNCQKNEYATCNICGLKVKDEEVLDLHMNLHEGKTELECRYCSKKFSHKRNVLRHMEVHWDKKKYQCEKCGERFSLSWLMYNHLMRHDAEEHALICEVCHQQFKTKRTYKHHLRTHQTDRPRYQCPDCEKSFVDKYTLKVHKRVHLPVEASQAT
ncbi:serendipity locus protein beta [Drosophila sulfurigaster albostrigata]|uniref:serendipity locus protein beta n=1 Tax=Drosophila sulfurigaster albostrigata TaxID=89887 RepID=UPI002D21A40E|nr:serendipity locus protein beta [Drosophila sulfurigaster albostrigata]